MIGMPCYNDIPPHTALALAQTFYTVGKMGLRCDIALEVCGLITHGRNAVLSTFLSTDTQKLLWIDSDVVWTPDTLIRILTLSYRHDIVCGAYPAKGEGKTQYHIVPAENAAVDEEAGLLEITGTGIGFTICDRKVIEAICATKPAYKDLLSGRDVPDVFRLDTTSGHLVTEDYAFFADVRALGFKVWLDPAIELGHIGRKQWRGQIGRDLEG